MEKILIVNAGTLSGLFSLGKSLIRENIGHEPTDEELNRFYFNLAVGGSVPSIEIIPQFTEKEI